MRVSRRWTRTPVLASALFLMVWLGTYVNRVVRSSMGHLERLIEPVLERQLGRDVTIGRAYVSGMGRVVVEDLTIPDGKDAGSPALLHVRRAIIDVGLVDLAMHRDQPIGTISSLRIEEPEIRLVRRPTGEWNISDLFGVRTERAAWKDFRGRLVVAGGVITVRDRATGARGAFPASRIGDVSLAVDAANAPNLQITASASAGKVLQRVGLSGRYHSDQHDLDLRADFAGADLPAWQRYSGTAPTLPARSGSASGSLRVTQKAGGSPHIEGDATAAQVVMAPAMLRRELVAETLRIGIDGPKLLLRAEGRAGQVPLSLNGSLILRDHRTFLDLDLRSPRLVENEARQAIRGWPAVPGVVWDGPAEVRAHVTGPATDWTATFDGRLPQVTARGFRFTDLRVSALYRRAPRLVYVRSAQARVTGGTIQATGSVDVKSSPSRVAFTGAAENVDFAQVPLMAGTTKQGRGRVTFAVRGPIDNVRATLSASGSNIRLGPASLRRVAANIDLPWKGSASVRASATGIESAEKGGSLPPAQSGTATFRVLPNRVQVESARVVVDGQSVAVSGTATAAGALDLRLSAAGLDAAKLGRILGFDGLAGRGDVTARVTGSTSQPRAAGHVTLARGQVRQLSFAGAQADFDVQSLQRGSVRFTVAEPRVSGVPVAMRTASGRADLEGKTIRLAGMRVDLFKGVVTAEGKATRDGALDLGLKASGVDLATLTRAFGQGAGAINGLAGFDGHVGGRLDAPRLSGSVAVAGGALRGLRFNELRAQIDGSADGLTARNITLRRDSETITLAGRVDAGRNGAVAVDARAQSASFDMGEAARALGLALPVAGRGRADLQVKGTYPALAIAGTLEVQDAVVSSVPVGRAKVRFQAPQGVGRSAIVVEELVVEDGTARLVATGSVTPAGGISLDFDGSGIPLERLGAFTDPYARLAGQADVRGTLRGTLTAPQVALNARAAAIQVNGQPLGAVSGDLAYADGSATVTGLTAAGGNTTYQVGQFSYRRADGRIALEASAHGADLAQLDALLRSVRWPQGSALQHRVAAIPSPLSGQGDVSVTLSGRWPNLDGHATFALAQVAAGEAHAERVAGTVTWSPKEIELRDGVLKADGVDLAGSLKWGPGDYLTTEAHLRNTRMEALRALALKTAAVDPAQPGSAKAGRISFGPLLKEAVAGIPQPFAGVVTADANLQGRLGALDGLIHFQVQDARIGGAALANAGATVRWDQGSIAADDLALQAAGVDVRGNLRRAVDGSLSLQITLGDSDAAATRDLARALVAVARAYRGGRLVPASAATVLADLPDPLSGKVSGTLSLTGKPGALQGSVSARAANLQIGPSELASVAAEGAWSRDGFSFPTLSVTGKECSLTGSLALDGSGRLSGSLATENARLQELRAMLASATFLRRFAGARTLMARVEALPSPLAGTVTGSVQLSGTLTDPTARVAVSGTDLAVGAYRLSGLKVDADVVGSVATIREFEARANGGNISARGTVNLDGAVDLTVTGTDFSLAALGKLPGTDTKIAGHVDLTARVTGTAEQPVAEARVVVRDGEAGGIHVDRIQAEGVRLANGRMDLGRVEVQQGSVIGWAAGSLPFRWDPIEIPTDEPVQLTLSIPEVEIASSALAEGGDQPGLNLVDTPEMRPLLDVIESASGRAAAELAVTGTLRAPSMNGKVEVHGGQFKLAGLDNTFKDVDALLRLDGPWVVIEHLKAQSDRGGTITATGRAGIRAHGDQTLDVQVHTEQFQLGLQNVAGVRGLAFKGTANGDVALKGRLDKPVLTGKVQLAQVQVNVPSEITPRLQRPPQTLFDPTLDVEVAVGSGSWVRRGSVLEAMVTATMGVRGKLSDPVVGGRAVVERGDLRYAGINFRLEPGGSASFAYDTVQSLTARLDLTATTRIRAASPSTGDRRNYTVTMHLTGPMPNVNVAVTSDPPDLPQYRLMAILSRTDQFDAAAKGQDLQNVLRDQVADILTGTVLPQVFEPIEEGLANALGLDEVHFDYGFDRPLRVDARKEVLPRVYVSYNRGMGQGQLLDSAEEWSVTYRVYQRLFVGWRRDSSGRNDRLVLEGSFKF